MTEITINCRMDEKWLPYFVSMLRKMQNIGEVDDKKVVGIVAGAKHFHPQFDIDFSETVLSIGEDQLEKLNQGGDAILSELAHWEFVNSPLPSSACTLCSSQKGLGITPEGLVCRQCMYNALKEMLQNPDGYIYDTPQPD
jgi:hypothetical protein